MRQVHGRPPVGGERRQTPRWRDKKLVTVLTRSDEVPGMTGDLSLSGMRIGLPCAPGPIGERVEVSIAFAQEVLAAQCEIVYLRHRPWGALAGLRYVRPPADFRAFLTRRYCRPHAEDSAAPHRPALDRARRVLAELTWPPPAPPLLQPVEHPRARPRILILR
jgi:hypothetical protein